jgi:hypothetical protein
MEVTFENVKKLILDNNLQSSLQNNLQCSNLQSSLQSSNLQNSNIQNDSNELNNHTKVKLIEICERVEIDFNDPNLSVFEETYKFDNSSYQVDKL